MKDTATIIKRAVTLETMANEVDTIAAELDDSGDPCNSCGMMHYHNWPQRQMRKRVEGVSERLREIATTLYRRASDPVFLTGITPDGEESELETGSPSRE